MRCRPCRAAAWAWACSSGTYGPGICGGGVMTLRQEYSLGHSEYNAFLFSAVGEEAVGLPLTVLTALARLGIDPWQEAARLSDLPRETAARLFAQTIAKLPEGDWKASDAETIAARLVDSLPLRSAPPIPSTADRRARGAIEMKNSRFPAWLGWSVLFVAALVLTLYLQPDRNLESPQGQETTTQR